MAMSTWISARMRARNSCVYCDGRAGHSVHQVQRQEDVRSGRRRFSLGRPWAVRRRPLCAARIAHGGTERAARRHTWRRSPQLCRSGRCGGAAPRGTDPCGAGHCDRLRYGLAPRRRAQPQPWNSLRVVLSFAGAAMIEIVIVLKFHDILWDKQ